MTRPVKKQGSSGRSGADRVKDVWQKKREEMCEKQASFPALCGASCQHIKLVKINKEGQGGFYFIFICWKMERQRYCVTCEEEKTRERYERKGKKKKS